MSNKPKTIKEYLADLPAERRAALNAVREVILANLPEGYAECIQYGMIGYVVPHSLYPAGYHCKPSEPLSYIALGSQKNHMALHLMCVYGNKETHDWFCKAYKATGKKLDMGKACLRFKKLEDLPLDVIGQLVARTSVKKYIAGVEQALNARAKRGKPAKKS